MGKCRFLKQKKQVLVNGEWVDTRSYKYTINCDGSIPYVSIKNGVPNVNATVMVRKYDSASTDDEYFYRTTRLDANGNGYIELESDDCIMRINLNTDLQSKAVAEIKGCYVSYLGSDNIDKFNVYCSMFTGLEHVDILAYKPFKGSSITFKAFDTSEATNMAYMFSEDSNIKTLDLSGWDTRNVYRTYSMFERCKKLETLDLSGWDLSKTYDHHLMFSKCSALRTIYLRGCNQKTFDVIKKEVTNKPGISENITIITE